MDQKRSYRCCVFQLETFLYPENQHCTYVLNDAGSVDGLR